jgi:hypothetical protein
VGFLFWGQEILEMKPTHSAGSNWKRNSGQPKSLLEAYGRTKIRREELPWPRYLAKEGSGERLEK